MKAAATIPELVAERAQAAPNALALLAPGRDPVTYEALARHVASAASALSRCGIGRNSRVAIALAPGPEAATAFLAAACAGIAAPLNPAYIAAEFESYLTALKPAALIVEADGGNEAAKAARKLGIPVLRVKPGAGAGVFALETPPAKSRAGKTGKAKPGDVALLLHTSGTTAKPKLVPLTHANLLASARAVAATLALSPADRGLCVMPLFHIHGLVAALLAPLYSGGSIVVPPGFHAIGFFSWMETFAPSWVTAVPSMYQSLLARAAQHRQAIARAGLRFIRSSSAALPPSVLESLERIFNAPVIESYGMTEAAHQMASNPLPPAKRKPGTVGLAAGPEIAILGADGKHLPPGRPGEVVIRGPNVSGGYLENPRANAAAFVDGWFRTGDLGMFDADLYLTLISRIKEIINRGGEKIAPREVEEALLAHPSVAEAAAFPVPDESLGEEVGCAVVLKPGASATVPQLKEFASRRLTYFKLPRHLVVVDAIPKGATGKIQRAGLAKRLDIAPARGESAADATPPGNALESLLCELWREVLHVETVGIHAPFLDLGGDSILAAQMVAKVNAALSLALTMADVWDTPTVAEMAARVATKQRARATPIARRPEGAPPPPSFSQEWWLSLEDNAPESPASNRPSSLVLEGRLDGAALSRAFSALVARHESLRMTFTGKAGARQLRIAPAAPVMLEISDLSSLSQADSLARAKAEAKALAGRPFALDSLPLWRAKLIRLAESTHILAFVVHHAVFDGWSMAVFARELAVLYGAEVRGTPASLPQLPVGYGDFASWQRREIAGARLAALEKFWKETLKGAPRPPVLPFAKSRPARPSLRGGEARRAIPSEVVSDLRQLGRAEGATLYMALLAVFHALIARYTGAGDVVTGCLVAGRERAECENLIGLFFNALPLRGDVSGDPTPRALVARTRGRAVSAFAHHDMPISRLAALAPAPSPGESPVALVPVLFQMRNLPAVQGEGAGVRFTEFHVENEHARFDLTFDVGESETGLDCALAFNADIFSEADARTILSDFASLCAGFAVTPDARLSALPVPKGLRS
ncbi:MAG TPA: condensation domain-containing protein [Alphaproteobacteria bacterium]|nr:condensation domain-containing protein [Alphaproteobacteria bacterium]